MLQQKWFYDSKFLIVDDCGEVQVFFDKDNRAFYSVEKDTRDNMVIVEIQPKSGDYAYYINCYGKAIIQLLLEEIAK